MLLSSCQARQEGAHNVKIPRRQQLARLVEQIRRREVLLGKHLWAYPVLNRGVVAQSVSPRTLRLARLNELPDLVHALQCGLAAFAGMHGEDEIASISMAPAARVPIELRSC